MAFIKLVIHPVSFLFRYSHWLFVVIVNMLIVTCMALARLGCAHSYMLATSIAISNDGRFEPSSIVFAYTYMGYVHLNLYFKNYLEEGVLTVNYLFIKPPLL